MRFEYATRTTLKERGRAQPSHAHLAPVSRNHDTAPLCLRIYDFRSGGRGRTLRAMKRETVENAKLMLLMLLEQGASYAKAGKAFGLTRSTVERNVKALLRGLVADGEIAGLDEDAATSLLLVRRASRDVLSALERFEPKEHRRSPIILAEKDLEQAAARLRRRSQNPSRDMTLLAVLYQTGAKPVELARLRVDDVLTPGGSVRIESHIRAEVAFNGQCRPLHLTSPAVRRALDRYLDDRVRRYVLTGPGEPYRGIDPCSPLFLTRRCEGFKVRPRGARDPRETCPLMTATLRIAFRRAGWPGLTAQAVRRMAARRMLDEGASPSQIAELLGLRSERGARLLLGLERTESGTACPLSGAEPQPGIEAAKPPAPRTARGREALRPQTG